MSPERLELKPVAALSDDERAALRALSSAVYDEGETPEEAVVRETFEECGLVIRVGECVSRAVQLVVVEDVLLEKRSLFFEARIESERPGWSTGTRRCGSRPLPPIGSSRTRASRGR